MSVIYFAYTDKRLKRSEYSLQEMLGDKHQLTGNTSLNGSPIPGIRFSKEELCRCDAEAAGHLFPDLRRYLVHTGAVRFNYHKTSSFKEGVRLCIEWLFDLIREHLRNGAKKFYFAQLWASYNPDERKPKNRKIDLANFELNDEEFDFGFYTVCEFVDSSMK